MFGKKASIDNFTLGNDVLRNATLLHVLDNIRIHVENHKGIIEYSVDKIRINTKKGIIHITGNDLYLKEIDMTDILIFGRIRSIKYP